MIDENFWNESKNELNNVSNRDSGLSLSFINNRSEFLNSWLGDEKTKSVFVQQQTKETIYRTTFALNNQAVKFTPEHLVTPGWGGESLNSKDALKIKKIIHELWLDAEIKLSSFKEINPSLKQSLFNNFISFAQINNFTAIDISGPQAFWDHFVNPNSCYKKELIKFIKVHSFRSVALYIFKVRFLTKLSFEIGQELHEKIVLAPNALFSHYFPKSGNFEINCPSFRVNEYSWYGPSVDLAKKVLKILPNLDKISLQEIMRICTYRPNGEFLDKKQMYCETEFSHSLSHKTFGSFLKLILDKFPGWVDTDKKEQFNSFYRDISHNIKHCRFSGDYVSSFSQSHWLAEKEYLDKENNKTLDENIIFPEFEGQSFNEGEFTKLIHEIQFLTFLVEKYQDLKKIKNSNFEHFKIEKGIFAFLSLIFNSKNAQRSSSPEGQFSLFPNFRPDFQYDYVVLNVSKLPKNNQHHHLLGQALNQSEKIKNNGVLFLFTGQQLFVPSKSEKVDQLLKKFKIEAIFDFEELKGRGEICPYLYVFRKRNEKVSKAESQNFTDNLYNHKESFLRFRWSGELKSFSVFNSVVKELESFLCNKSPLTPLFQSEATGNINFSFHQDAIIDGKLLQSSNKNNQVTHPHFFKNLTKNCLSFDHFFAFESIDPAQESNLYGRDNFINLINKDLRIEDLYPFILIVGHENIHEIFLEIIPSSSFKAKLNQLGHAYYQYFGLRPKIPHLNPNLFREYFNTDIGKQIAEFSLNGGPTKTKGKLKGLMIPAFFASKERVKREFISTHPYLTFNSSQILALHPQELGLNIERLKNVDINDSASMLADFLGILCQFKVAFNDAIEQSQDISEFASYNNPIFIEKLKSIKTYPLFPDNADIYIKFLVANKLDLHSPISEVVKKSNEFSTYLEVMNGDSILCQIFSDSNMISFIQFLMKFALNRPLNLVLQSMRIPKAQDLLKILNEKEEIKSQMQNAKNNLDGLITRLIISQISS